jgi:Carboxypeptidase regulatory-like domain
VNLKAYRFRGLGEGAAELTRVGAGLSRHLGCGMASRGPKEREAGTIEDMNRYLIVLCVLCGTCVAAERGTLRGTVSDSEGAAIKNAQLFIHWDSSGSSVGLTPTAGSSQDIKVRTDQLGRFEVTLPPGFYDVMVSANAFSPQCRKIRLVQAFEYNLKLAADPLVTKELGDLLPQH